GSNSERNTVWIDHIIQKDGQRYVFLLNGLLFPWFAAYKSGCGHRVPERGNIHFLPRFLGILIFRKVSTKAGYHTPSHRVREYDLLWATGRRQKPMFYLYRIYEGSFVFPYVRPQIGSQIPALKWGGKRHH